jgi:hypothetical protein
MRWSFESRRSLEMRCVLQWLDLSYCAQLAMLLRHCSRGGDVPFVVLVMRVADQECRRGGFAVLIGRA